jgi:chromosome partitioning protein
MSRTPRRVSKRRPRVIVVGNHKGGSGKTTLAMHMVVALLKEGKRVACFDMDRRQQTLTRYIENRREWAAQTRLALEVPHHCPVSAAIGEGEAGIVRAFIERLKEVQRGFDFIVIDTPGGDDHLSLLAHGMADTLVTPINDSFIDLDAIMKVGPSKDFEPSCYAETVAAARRGRKSVSSQPIDWIVVRNRLAPGVAPVGQGVGEVLELKAQKIGYRVAPGLSERLVFRAFFPIGATAFDPLEDTHLEGQPLMSHLLARMEVRQLIETIGLVSSTVVPGNAPPQVAPSQQAQGQAVRLPPVSTLEDTPVAMTGP